MGTKRTFGETTRRTNGRWGARYTGPDGRRHTPGRTFATKDHAIVWLTREQRLIDFDEWTPPAQRRDNTTDTPSAPTVGEWVREWLTTYTPHLKPSTRQNYQGVLDRRFFDEPGAAGRLQHTRLDKVTRRDIADWRSALIRRHGHTRDVDNALTRLRTALSAAVDAGLIDASPATGIRNTGRATAKKKDLPDAGELRAVVAQLPDRYRIVGVLTLFHGMRIGEVLALRRRCVVDTPDGVRVKVEGTVYRKPGEGMAFQDGAKTAAGNRMVPVFAQFEQLVRDHLARFVGDSRDAWVCTTPTGNMLMDTTFRTAMHAARQRAGVDKVITPHVGRVWLITALVEAGMTIPAIGEILGQRDLKTITEVYMRTSEQRKREALGRVNLQLGAL